MSSSSLVSTGDEKDLQFMLTIPATLRLKFQQAHYTAYQFPSILCCFHNQAITSLLLNIQRLTWILSVLLLGAIVSRVHTNSLMFFHVSSGFITVALSLSIVDTVTYLDEASGHAFAASAISNAPSNSIVGENCGSIKVVAARYTASRITLGVMAYEHLAATMWTVLLSAKPYVNKLILICHAALVQQTAHEREPMSTNKEEAFKLPVNVIVGCDLTGDCVLSHTDEIQVGMSCEDIHAGTV